MAPERMQRVQTDMRLTAPPIMTRTRWRFGIQRRLETLWAWLTRFPKTGALPQTSHIFAMLELPQITRKAQIVVVTWKLCNCYAGEIEANARNRFTYLNSAELTPLIKGCNFDSPFITGASEK
jgi:hypothetical protein